MRILFLTPQLPYPPQKGTALRNWGLISGLAERHEVAVLSFLASPPPSFPPNGGMKGGGHRGGCPPSLTPIGNDQRLPCKKGDF